ncbi:MAG TPA: hypothetical protein VHS99_21825, partial [Chloroflexota bacterium]|nr:hypothetical protein [Chloroflexota bacterium]
LWILVVSWLPGGRGRRSLAALSGACLAGIGLSAFFWLPAIWEIRQTQYDLLKETLFRWDVRLFDPLRVVGAVAQPDYPHTRLGPADLSPVFSYQALNRSAPEKIALAQLLLWLFALAGTVAAFARRQMLAGGLAACLTGLALGCWWLNTTWSQPVWAHLPLIEFAQYPWRLYGPLALSTALAAGVVLAALPPGGLRLAGRVVAGGLVLLLAVGSLAARPAELGPLPPHDVNGRNQAESERNYYGAGTTTGGEYLPPTVSIAQYDPRIPRGLKVYEEAYPQVTWQAGLVHLLRGEGAVTQVGAGRTWVAARVEASQPLALGIHQLWFPGWRGFVDGQEVPLHPAPYDEQRQASLGFMVLEVPPGTHQVEVRLGPTPLRQAGTFVTWATLGLAGAWWLRLRVWPAPATVPALLTAAGLGLLLGLGAVVLQGWRALPWPGGAIPGARVAVDVAAAIGQGKVEVRSPAGSSRAWQPPYVDQRWLTIGGETRRWLGLHPPAEVAVSLRVPAGAYLQAALGIDPEVWERPTGDGVRFVLEAERRHQGTREVVWARGVNPRARGEDRRWLDVWVSLAHLAGQEVTLILRTEPRDDATFDWAGWANPQVVVWDAPRLSPAAAREQGALS